MTDKKPEQMPDVQKAIDRLNLATARARLRHSEQCPSCGYPDKATAPLPQDRQAAYDWFKKLIEQAYQANVYNPEPYPVKMKGIIEASLLQSPGDAVADELAAAAEKIKHWHDRGEGMVVSAESVRGLWEALANYNKFKQGAGIDG